MRLLLIVFLFSSAALFGQHSDFDPINFKKADSIAYENKGASLKNLPVLVFNLTADLDTDVEKFRSIYTWVCTNIENDYSAYQKIKKKRKKLFNDKEALIAWNDSFKPKVFNNLLKHKKTSCTGYAYILRELALLADIKCTIVNGYSRTPTLIIDEKSIPNHSWNAVEINGKWYLCDPTWSAGKIVIKDNLPTFEASYFDGYFLANPNLFIKNHYPLDTNWALLEEVPSFESFVNGFVIYKEAFKNNITAILPTNMHLEVVKNEAIQFTLSTSKTIKEEAISLALNRSTIKIQPKITKNKNDYLLEYAFSKSGTYDVHLKIDDTIIATYVVKIKRK